MNHVFVGRQPIYDGRLRVAGYELLYREGKENATQERTTETTAKLLFSAVIEVGLEKLVGKHPAFINLTADMLTAIRQFSPPRDRVVFEVLEDVANTEAVVSAIKELKSAGYRLALDDFAYTPSQQALLPYADIVKVDVLQSRFGDLLTLVRRLKRMNLTLVAEKVENLTQFQVCKDLGFDWFQGHFLSRPHVIRAKTLSPNKAAVLQLLARLSDPNVRLEELEAIISRDVALSYKLLRCINSAYYALPRKVESIREAILFLGTQTIISWVSLVALAGFAEKPPELFAIALIRAKMCERLGILTKSRQPDKYFTVGLLSVLDVLMDMPMEDLVRVLPLSEDVNAVLLGRDRESPLGRALVCTLAYEKGDWDAVGQFGLETAVLSHAYIEAVGWASETTAVLLRSSKSSGQGAA
jgi:EAL and modified HD-GYP domain-containing signal transduction protein